LAALFDADVLPNADVSASFSFFRVLLSCEYFLLKTTVTAVITQDLSFERGVYLDPKHGLGELPIDNPLVRLNSIALNRVNFSGLRGRSMPRGDFQ